MVLMQTSEAGSHTPLVACARRMKPLSKRQQKGKGTASGAGRKGDNSPRFTDDQREEALKGIQETLRASRIKKKLCQRCALSGHHWKYCRKEINVSSLKKKKTKKDDTSKEDIRKIQIPPRVS